MKYVNQSIQLLPDLYKFNTVVIQGLERHSVIRPIGVQSQKKGRSCSNFRRNPVNLAPGVRSLAFKAGRSAAKQRMREHMSVRFLVV